ncbi:MAG: hypothetical protein FVQ77_11940, partial [Cytophagales bacterium]|nr:hypothetical protein [Cytophagales bacterium]
MAGRQAQDTLRPPIITIIDTCPPPRTITVPTKPGGSYIIQTPGGPRTIPLTPPKAAPATQPLSNFTTYDTEQGLALSGIACGYLDRSGNLWFGTVGGGVSRYDGKSFTTYTTAQGLAGNSVWSITEDKSGNLWFGTSGGGVSRYDGKSFTTYTTAQRLAHNVVTSITEDKSGNLWFGTYGGGVSRYDGV